MQAMTPTNPRWEEFIERLEGIEGCSFHRDSNEEIHWTCSGDLDRGLSTNLLKRMGLNDEAITESLAFFKTHGGYCDCEVIFNVAGSL